MVEAKRGARRRPSQIQSISLAPGLICLCGSVLSPGLARARAPEPPAAEVSGADATSADAEAQPAKPSPETLAEARERFDRGLELYADEDFALALIEFRRAYALVPNYRVLFNIGQVSVQLGSYADARRAFEEYLESGGEQLSEERRASVARDLEMLRRRTAFLQVTANVKGAEIIVDDVSVGRAPLDAPLLVDAGVHRVVVRRPGYLQRSTRVTLAGGDEETLAVRLDEQVKHKETIVVREAKPNDDDSLMIAGWVTTGALAAGAIVTGIMGAGEAKELQQLRRSSTEPDTGTRIESAQSNARSLLLASDVFSGAALVVGGLSLWVTVSPSEKNGPDSTNPKTPSKSTPGLEIGYHRGQIKLRGHF